MYIIDRQNRHDRCVGIKDSYFSSSLGMLSGGEIGDTYDKIRFFSLLTSKENMKARSINAPNYAIAILERES